MKIFKKTLSALIFATLLVLAVVPTTITLAKVSGDINVKIALTGNTTPGGSVTGNQPPTGSLIGNPSTRPSGGSKFTNPIKATNLYALLADFLKVITMLGAIIVVIFFILAGFKYVTARGDEKKIGDATRALTWTAVGAAVLLGAQVLARVIQNTVTQLG